MTEQMNVEERAHSILNAVLYEPNKSQLDYVTHHLKAHGNSKLRGAAERIRTLGEQHVAVQGSSRSISQATREKHAKAIEELIEEE